MHKYILLFRGINVGGNHLIPMKELKSLLQPEFGDVETYIQTGNVIVENSSVPVAKVSEIVVKNFGFQPSVLSLSQTELSAAINHNPYKKYEGKTVHFYFCSEKPKGVTSEIDALIANNEAYEIHDNVFYFYAPNGIGRSKLAAKVEKLLGVTVTARNLNTVTKIQSLMS